MSNAVVNSFLADSCKVVLGLIAGTLPANTTTSEIAKALSLVKTKLAGIGPWSVNIRAAEAVLAARKDAEEKLRIATRAVADEVARKVRMEANIRHKRNRAEKAEMNRKMAKGFGSGTQKKMEGKSKRR